MASSEHGLPGLHPMAAEHLPAFITAPGETDILFNVTVVVVIVMIFVIGTLYLRLHSLPEQIAHSGTKTQFTLVGVLALLALFTHNNIYWVAALVLALVKLPDFSTPLDRIADALERRDGGTPTRAPEPVTGDGAPDGEPRT